MAYAPQKKKKSLWDNIVDTLGGAADAIIPGDQSGWRSAPTRAEQQVQPVSRPQAQQPSMILTQPRQQGIPLNVDDNEPIFGQANKPVTPVVQSVNDTANIVNTSRPSDKITIAQPQKQPNVVIAKPQPQPNIQVQQAPEQPKNTYTDYKIEKVGNKKLFGLDVGQYLGDFGDENKMTVGGHAQLTEQDFLKSFDFMSRENAKYNTGKQTRDMYVNKLKDLAQNGDENAKFTLQTLEKNGKLKGDWTDTLDSTNNEFLGGVNRSAARVIDWLPGDQGTAKWADNQEKIWKGSTEADKVGENIGKAERVGLDVGLMLTPAGWVDKTVKGTKVVQGIGNFNKVAGGAARILPGSAVATGMDMFSQASQGNDQDLTKSALIGTGVDLALPVAGKVISKIPGSEKAVGAVIDSAGNVIRKGGEFIEAGKHNVAEVKNKLRNTVDDMIDAANERYVANHPGTGFVPQRVARESRNGTIKINNPDGAVYGQTPTTDLTPQELPVVSVKRADGRLEQYQPKSAEELAVYQKQIDDARVANGDTAEGVAGKPDANGDVWHISSGSQVKKNYTPIEEAPTPAFTAPNKRAIDGDATMQRLRERAANPVQQPNIAEAYGLKPETVQRLVRDYGEDKARSIIQRSSDATNIRSMDAFVVSEAKKAYGAVPKTVKVVKPVDEPQPMTEWADEYNGQDPRIQEATPTEERLIENKLADEQRVADYRDRNSVLTDQQERQLADQAVQEPPRYEAPRSNAVLESDAPLGKIAETFYDSKVGNQKIKFRDLEALGNKVSQEINRTFKEAGSDFPTVARKIEEAQRNGVKSLDGVDLTDTEKNLWRGVQSEMDYVRRRASLGRRDVSTGDFGELYFPNEKAGTYPTRDSLFEGFRQNKPGNEAKRTGAIDLDELSYNADVIGGYVTRYGDTKLLQEERIYRALAKNNPDLEEGQIRDAAQKVIELQNKVNAQKTKITLGGFGKKVTVTNGKTVEFADEMNAVGKELGKPQKEVVGTPRGLTNGDRINSVDIDDNGTVKTVGDFLGLNQFRDAGAYAGTQYKNAGGDREVLADMVAERLNTAYKLPQEDVDYAVQSILNMKADLPDNVAKARVEAIYRNAAKSQLMEQLQNVTLQNKTLKRDVTTLANQIVREGSIEQELSAKVVQNTMRAQNALFRKLNVSSALNEFSDMSSFFTIYGKNLKAATPDFSLIQKYGVGEIDPSIEPFIKAVDAGMDQKSILTKINEGTRLYKYVETYKAGTLLKTAEDFYRAKGLTGDALTQAVLKDYRDFALPVDMFTKTFLNDFPLYTQYLSWGARNMQKEGRLLTGQFDAGLMADKTVGQRIARDLYANIPAKTAFWLASNGLKGTTIMTAFGLTDFTGLTNQDYSGIAEEDKSFFDRTTQFTNISTTASLLNTIVQAWEKEQLKNDPKYANGEYNPYENSNFGDTLVKTYTPQFIKNGTGAIDLQNKGYSENAGGRVQYEAPDDPWNIFKSFVFGKNQTANAREYSGRENLVDRVNEGKDPFTAVKDMAAEQLGLQETDYNRPLTEDYSKKYKSVEEGARTALLEGGRQYNAYLDDLRKNSPDLYNSYIGAMDGNHVSPEYWRSISQNVDGKPDLTTFHMMRDRKRQLQKDLGKGYDPLYDLPDDQAAAVLQYKSTATGDDLALRNTLNKEQWYKDLKDRQKEFYAANPKEESDGFTNNTERVKQWEALDDQLSNFYFDPKKETPSWANDYPLVYEQKIVNDKFGFGSPESDAFFKANGDAYKAQKEGYDKAQLGVINQMREIEGFPPMTWEAYQQATKIADTDKSDDKEYGKSGGGGGSDISPNAGGSYSHTGASKAAAVVKVNKGSGKKLVKRGESRKIAIKRGGRI